MAMTNSATTLGHCLQGFLASFLSFPAIVGIIARLAAKRSTDSTNSVANSILASAPSVPLMLTLHLAQACMTIYPSYSGIKRFIKSSESFSRTSHMNNTTEWILGYFLGVGIGWCLTVLLQCYLYKSGGLNTSGAHLICGGNDDEARVNDESKISSVIEMLKISDE
eukprot:364580_1